MGGKYEIRYKVEKGWIDVYTNNWFEFMWVRLTKKVIYYKIYCD